MVNTVLPAVERAMIEAVPLELEAAKVTQARPFEPVVTLVVLPLPVKESEPAVKVPALVVNTSKLISTPCIGLPRLFKAMTSRFFGAVVPGSIV